MGNSLAFLPSLFREIIISNMRLMKPERCPLLLLFCLSALSGCSAILRTPLPDKDQLQTKVPHGIVHTVYSPIW